MKYVLYGLFFLVSPMIYGQVGDPEPVSRRKAGKAEVNTLAQISDSVLYELRNLYKLEVQENSPRKYQPERIALVRSYLLVFQSIQNTSDIVAYSSKDISTIFGKPDTIIYTNAAKTQCEWLYGKIQTKYVRINNLRYRFYFKNNVLEAVKRDDQ
jgi:hypothetical protein